jgi:cytoskeletal protein RodZ
VSASFPTLAAARQALDGVLAHDTIGARTTPEKPTDEAWRQVRASVLDAESERSSLRRRRFTGVVAILGWAVLIGAAALTINWLRHRADQAPAASANEPAPTAESAPLTPTESPPAVASVAPDAAPGAAAPAGPAAAGARPTASAAPVGTTGNGAAAPRARVEVHTTREVWMRTRVDERPFRERLVPANQVLEFNPARTFYVRAGDAGGLRVVIDGEDRGVIGGDGRVVARTFPIPPRPEPR